jgi:phosphatidylserine/phosphatidylglycerophosphate/cardiolipin synthase-like enzyme
VIIERLVRAVRRGVRVHVMARPPHTLKRDKLVEGVGGLRILDDVGAKVHTLKHLKLHAKMMLADGKRAIVGSINLAPGSFDSRRELAIEVDDEHVIKRLQHVAEHDWQHSHPLDLSDEGLLADLEKRSIDATAELGLHPQKKER